MGRGKARIAAAACATLTLAVVVWLFFFHGETPPRAIIHVHPGESIQAALEDAAARPGKAIVKVHAGVYRPSRSGQALVYFNARHDGIVLEGVGDVVLTAANPDLADPRSISYPAVVNHVVYFGDQVSSTTIFRNFKVTGGNGFLDGPPGLIAVRTPEELDRSASFRAFESPIESNDTLVKTHEFFSDGGGILVYGKSYPIIENVEIHGNRSLICGGGASVQQHSESLVAPVLFRNCIFRDNQAGVSGSALDVYPPGSWADLENCLFVRNVSDEKLDFTKKQGYGALSVFPTCRATVSHCTFTDNWSAVDDRGYGSIYQDSIFWKNTRTGGILKTSRYELDVAASALVEGCFLHGSITDLRLQLPQSANHLDPPDPQFDSDFHPRNPFYGKAGYRANRDRSDVRVSGK